MVKAVEGDFKALPQDVERFVSLTWVLPLEHKKTKLRVDVIFSATQLERKAIKRAKKVQVEDIAISYILPEELVVQKVIAGRPKGLEDAKGILNVQGEGIDQERIERLIRSFAQETGEMEWLPDGKPLTEMGTSNKIPLHNNLYRTLVQGSNRCGEAFPNSSHSFRTQWGYFHNPGLCI